MMSEKLHSFFKEKPIKHVVEENTFNHDLKEIFLTLIIIFSGEKIPNNFFLEILSNTRRQKTEVRIINVRK